MSPSRDRFATGCCDRITEAELHTKISIIDFGVRASYPCLVMHKLTENHFSFKCPMNWDEMEVSGSGRHCCKCQKQVFDLTNCSIDEVIALQRKHGPICGSIRVAQVAAVAVSLSAAACQTTQPINPIMGKIRTSPEGDQPINRVHLSGTPRPPEQLEKMKGNNATKTTD